MRSDLKERRATVRWAAVKRAMGLGLVLGGITGCSISAESTCRDWQRSGAMMSTLSSCTRCYDQFGENLDAVRGCAVGVDAATLIGGAAAATR